MRKPVGPHKPSVDVSNSRTLAAYGKGLEDGLFGRVYEPRLDAQPDEKEAYKAGFDKARE